MKKFLILFVLFSLSCAAEPITLKWNNQKNQNCFLTYGKEDSTVSVQRNIGNVNSYKIDLGAGTHWFYITINGQQSNVIFYQVKSARTKREKQEKIKLEILKDEI